MAPWVSSFQRARRFIKADILLEQNWPGWLRCWSQGWEGRHPKRVGFIKRIKSQALKCFGVLLRAGIFCGWRRLLAIRHRGAFLARYEDQSLWVGVDAAIKVARRRGVLCERSQQRPGIAVFKDNGACACVGGGGLH